MSAGHLAMTFDQSFLLALLLLVVGSGLLKGNISAQVGALYPREDEARRTRGFVIFSTAHQCRRRRRPAGLRPARAGLWLALRLRRRRDLHAAWALRPTSTDIDTCRRKCERLKRRRHAARPRRPAHRLRAHRRDDHHDLPVGVLLPDLQRAAGLDPGACRARGRRLSHPGAVVPVDRFVFQHPGRAAAVVDDGSAWPSRGREPDDLAQDRHRRLDGRGQQPDPGGRDLRCRRRADSSRSGRSCIAPAWASPSFTTGRRCLRSSRARRRPR